MEQLNYTTNNNKSKHLTEIERGIIYALYVQGKSAYYIAKQLCRASNTIRNELRRGEESVIINGKYKEIYSPKKAQQQYEKNRKNSKKHLKLSLCTNFIDYIVDMIKEKEYSLDSGFGNALKTKKFKRSEMVCTKTLYNYVNMGKLKIKNIDLCCKVSMKSRNNIPKENKKIYGDSIEKRPEEINMREEFGHWEIDTIVGQKGKGKKVLMTITERKTRQEIIALISGKENNYVNSELLKITKSFPEGVFKSITSDNGSEFSNLDHFGKEQGIAIYFAHPYSSWERGTNENHNKLIRRFIGKGVDIGIYNEDKIKKIETCVIDYPERN
jgi:IS30 family transposase